MRARSGLQALVVVWAAAVSLPTHAAATRVYFFNANCEDCAISSQVVSYGVLAVLKLRNYDDGLPIDASSNFADFSYGGSNLVGAYHVGIDPQDGIPETLDFMFRLDPGSPDSVSGSMPFTLDLRFGNGLGFHADSNGHWYTCAPGPGWPAAGVPYHGGNDCSPFNNADHGVGSWSDVPTVIPGPGAPNAVPEPSTLPLVALGLAGAALCWPRRRLNRPARPR